tara:strand:+ start:346 stop:540 length:195 start_codon:yes stop_codon:yes gene_type:complete
LTTKISGTDPVAWLREHADPFEVIGKVVETEDQQVFHVPVRWANPNHSDATVVVDLTSADWFEL